MGAIRGREDYDQFRQTFHAGDYDSAFEYMVDEPRLNLFGHRITKRIQLGRLYRFLRDYISETVLVEKFAFAEDFVAVEAVVRVQGLQDLDALKLREQGLHLFHPIKAGEVQLMRNFVHYHLSEEGRIESGTCFAAPA
jgi:hypothetical protein